MGTSVSYPTKVLCADVGCKIRTKLSLQLLRTVSQNGPTTTFSFYRIWVRVLKIDQQSEEILLIQGNILTEREGFFSSCARKTPYSYC